MSDGLKPVWQRLDNVQPVFYHADLEHILNGGRDRLVGLGLLKETTPSLHAQCLECGNGHLVPAVWLPNVGTGQEEPRLPCPTCGPVPISADCLRRWLVDVPTLLARLSTVACIRQAHAEIVPNHLWYLGTATWCGRSRQVFFARATHAHKREAAVTAIKPNRIRVRCCSTRPNTRSACGAISLQTLESPWSRLFHSAPTV